MLRQISKIEQGLICLHGVVLRRGKFMFRREAICRAEDGQARLRRQQTAKSLCVIQPARGVTATVQIENHTVARGHAGVGDGVAGGKPLKRNRLKRNFGF
ncbi:hypothetical protein SDC9_210425 [bioreactor metagenome]|uniref:Uncharacterized protein n=1 Tax=bioreactor metagenome TaxID=1076179 RepID=A0A645JTS2_9ZZZZ